MKGRPLIPEEILKLEKGKLYDIQAERVKNTPKPEKPLEPRCPTYLNKAAKREWRYYAKVLKNYNLFVSANQKQLDLPVSYTHLTLPTIPFECRSRWSGCE